MEDINNGELKSKFKAQTSTGINIVVFILAAMAGWIDTAGIVLFLNGESGFMTGRVHMLGYHLFNFDLKLFTVVLLVIIAFIMGSFISTRITKKIGLKGGLILTGILVIISSLPVSMQYISAFFLPMAMGSQNAATSLTPLNRTTHLSGTTTDLGINLAKGNWNKVMFGACSFIGFPLGSFIGFNLGNMVDNNPIHRSLALIVPALIIILTGIIQDRKLNIPLLDEITNNDVK